MNVLVSLESLRSRLEFDDVASVNAALSASIRAATQSLKNLIRTEFDPVTGQTDYFYPRFMNQRGPAFGPPRDNFEGTGWVGGMGTGGMVTLRLAQGFLTAPPTSLVWATSMTDVANGNVQPIPLSIGGSSDEGYSQTDLQKGIVYIYDINLKQMVVQVTYNAGFSAKNSLYQNVPDWLEEACLTLAVVCLDEDYPAFRQERAADPSSILQRKDRLSLSLQRYVRYIANSEKPIMLGG